VLRVAPLAVTSIPTKRWWAAAAVLMAGALLGVSILGMRLACEGKTRVPGWGRRACADERMWIQSVPGFLGRMKLPVKVAPAWSSITSPGWEAWRAAWRSPPAFTGMSLPRVGGE
jgi:hypothetical protein